MLVIGRCKHLKHHIAARQIGYKTAFRAVSFILLLHKKKRTKRLSAITDDLTDVVGRRLTGRLVIMTFRDFQ